MLPATANPVQLGLSILRENLVELARHRNKILILGILMMFAGIAALSTSVMATFATMSFIGAMLLFGGLLELTGSFFTRSWGGFFVASMCGLLQALCGMIVLLHPLQAAGVFTLLIAGFLMASGVYRMLLSASIRFANWGFVFFNGMLGLLLGIIIWQDWPISGLWVIGTLVGIELIFTGAHYVSLASRLGKLAKHLEQPKPA